MAPLKKQLKPQTKEPQPIPLTPEEIKAVLVPPPSGPVAVNLADLLGVKKQDLPLICPHCRREVHDVVWRTFGSPAQAALVGCGNCRKILGSHLLGQLLIS